MPAAVRASERGVTLEIQVKVRARKSQVLGIKGDVVSVALAAPPVDGAANEALLRALAAHFGVAKSAVRLVTGDKSRRKVIELSGVDVATALARLGV
jgi:uncharacterized protein (TIGR00251 family)